MQTQPIHARVKQKRRREKRVSTPSPPLPVPPLALVRPCQANHVKSRRLVPSVHAHLAPDGSAEGTAGELRAAGLSLRVATRAGATPARAGTSPLAAAAAAASALPLEGVAGALRPLLERPLVALDEGAGLV